MALGACVAGGLLDGVVWPGTPLALFRPQLTLALLAASAASLAVGPRRVGLAGLAATAIGTALLVPAVRDPRPAAPAPGSPVVRLLALNLWERNGDVAAVAELVERERPDVVALTELTPTWSRALAPALRGYPVRAAAPRAGTSGIGVYGRRSLERADVVRLVEGGRPSVEAQLALGAGGTVRMLVVHPPSALLPGDLGVHERELAAIGAWARAQGPRTAVCGDLNAAAWTRTLRRAMTDGRLRPLLPGGLFTGSWPAVPAPLRVAIDGCLVGRGLRGRATLGPRVGSDHLPVLVELA